MYVENSHNIHAFASYLSGLIEARIVRFSVQTRSVDKRQLIKDKPEFDLKIWNLTFKSESEFKFGSLTNADLLFASNCNTKLLSKSDFKYNLSNMLKNIVDPMFGSDMNPFTPHESVGKIPLSCFAPFQTPWAKHHEVGGTLHMRP